MPFKSLSLNKSALVAEIQKHDYRAVLLTELDRRTGLELNIKALAAFESTVSKLIKSGQDKFQDATVILVAMEVQH